MPTTTSLLAFVAQRLRVAASFNIRDFRTTLSENEGLLRTTLRENETTLIKNRPRISGLDHIMRTAEAEPMCMSQIGKGAAFLHYRNWDDFWHNLNFGNR